MNFSELLIGLLGGGALAQLLQFLLTLRQNRRQMNSAALGSEIDALNTTIRLLQQQLESSAMYYEAEIGRLRKEVTRLRRQIDAMGEAGSPLPVDAEADTRPS